MALYRAMLADEAGVQVPETLPELSTGRLLTMTWLEGVPLLDYREAEAEVRNTVARNMFRAWYVPFYGYGVIHGDPHLGNYGIRPDNGLNLLDFGCDMQEALDMARVFYKDGIVLAERGVPVDAIAGLAARGHRVEQSPEPCGGGHAIWIDWQSGVLTAGSEPRMDGGAMGY